MKSDKGGDINLHPAAAVVAAGARGLPSGWACLATPVGCLYIIEIFTEVAKFKSPSTINSCVIGFGKK